MNPGPRNPESSSARLAEGVGAGVSCVFLVALVLGNALTLGGALCIEIEVELGAALGSGFGVAVGLQKRTRRTVVAGVKQAACLFQPGRI